MINFEYDKEFFNRLDRNDLASMMPDIENYKTLEPDKRLYYARRSVIRNMNATHTNLMPCTRSLVFNKQFDMAGFILRTWSIQLTNHLLRKKQQDLALLVEIVRRENVCYLRNTFLKYQERINVEQDDPGQITRCLHQGQLSEFLEVDGDWRNQPYSALIETPLCALSL